MTQGWRRLVANLSSALLAVFLAVIVWVVAVWEKAPPRTDILPVAIPIQMLDLGDNLAITNAIPTEVRIRVRALADTWGELKAESFEATADLLGLEDGEHEVSIVVTTLLQDVAIEEKQPASFTLRLERIEERTIRVGVRLLDEERVPLGYASRLPVVTPDQITITGPQTLVESVADAEVEVSIRDARDTVITQVAPVLLDGSRSRIQGVQIYPETVRVTVVVERQGGYRDVSVRASTQGSPAPGYWVSNISVNPLVVTVWGEQTVIEGLPGFVDTETIDVEQATGDVIERLSLALPEGVIVLGDAAADGILVQISVQPLLGGITLQGDLELRGLRPGLNAQPSPSVVDIILSGPLPALQELQPEDVRVILNLVGLATGTHRVNPVVVLPEGLGVEVKSIVPDIVEVIID